MKKKLKPFYSCVPETLNLEIISPTSFFNLSHNFLGMNVNEKPVCGHSSHERKTFWVRFYLQLDSNLGCWGQKRKRYLCAALCRFPQPYYSDLPGIKPTTKLEELCMTSVLLSSLDEEAEKPTKVIMGESLITSRKLGRSD